MRKYSPLNHRGLLCVNGSDRERFLQGLITQDIRKLAAQPLIYSALLSAQGRFLFDLFIFEHEGRYMIDSERARLEELKTVLSRYKLRADVQIDILPDWHVFSAPEAAGENMQNEFADPRTPAVGTRMYAETLPENITDFAAYNLKRLELGLPEGSWDMPVNQAIALENRLDEFNAISFDKGCFIGQELTARTHYRGLVRKKLFPVTIEGPAPAFDSPLLLNDKEAGHMRSAQDNMGLAMLRLESLENQQEIVLEAGDSRIIWRR